MLPCENGLLYKLLGVATVYSAGGNALNENKRIHIFLNALGNSEISRKRKDLKLGVIINY